MTEKRRLTHLDLLKCLALLMVIYDHGMLAPSNFIRTPTLEAYIGYYFRGMLSVSVPLFFAVNGYLLFDRPLNLDKHIRRMISLIAVTVAWSVILMPLYLYIAGEQLSVKKVLLETLLLDTKWAMNHHWFIGALICIYILFPAMKALFDSDQRGFRFFFICCILFTFGLVLADEILDFTGLNLRHYLGTVNYPFVNMLNPIRGIYGYSIVYFCAGGLIRKKESGILAIPARKRNTVAVAGILISTGLLMWTGLFYTRLTGEFWDNAWNGFDTVFTLINVFLFYVLSLNYKQDYSLIQAVSRHSLGIFFSHELILRLTMPWIRKAAFMRNIPCNLFYSFAVMCLSLLLCLGMKKIPLLKKMV